MGVHAVELTPATLAPMLPGGGGGTTAVAKMHTNSAHPPDIASKTPRYFSLPHAKQVATSGNVLPPAAPGPRTSSVTKPRRRWERARPSASFNTAVVLPLPGCSLDAYQYMRQGFGIEGKEGERGPP
jgi:hypothetical protein